MGAAFIVHGFEVSAEQRDAGLAAMHGEFTASDVRRAMAQCGVTDPPGQSYTVERAADRLMQAERRRKTIEAVTNRRWRRVAV